MNVSKIFLIGVYAFIAFCLFSYNHVWMQPEEFSLKSYALYQDAGLTVKDIARGLNYTVFEYAPRWTRPLSTYFEILDTKWRSWLWHFIPPHPSLSLTWIFSLILSPVFLYRFLRNLKLDADTALLSVCLYLMNPGFLSCVVMLFRPAKAMTNFSLIFALYWASCLSNKQTQGRMRGLDFAVFWVFLLVSLFWDETALLMIPAVMAFFPGLWKDRRRLAAFVCLPVIVLLAYYQIIPWMIGKAGYPVKHNLSDYIGVMLSLKQGIMHFMANTRLLILDSLGVAPLDSHAGAAMVLCQWAGRIAAIGLCLQIIKRGKEFVRRGTIVWAGGLLALLAVHSLLMSKIGVWGLYWYGIYWSIFFAVALGMAVHYAHIKRWLLFVCVGCILVNCGCLFLETNRIYKKFHYYPCTPDQLSGLFTGTYKRFDPSLQVPFSGAELRQTLWRYWKLEKEGKPGVQTLPKELFWAAIELNPGRYKYLHPFMERDKDLYQLPL